MDFHGERTTATVLHIGISPTQMTKNNEKKYKIAKMNEIISAVCALFNSGGGKLELRFDSLTPKQQVDTCTRMIEQRVVEMNGIMTVTSHTKFDVNSRGIILHLRNTNKLFSVNYNLYLPTERQVVAVPPTESPGKIKEIIHGKIVGEKTSPIRSHPKRFVKGQNCGVQEGINAQTKCLKASSSKCVTLADRITGKANKLSSYISAFANHCGGHIYYGVTDDGTVNGEELTDKDKDEIIKKVVKTVNKMVWPHVFGEPQRGTQWDIFFEPVEDASGNAIPSTFVIVIYVARCFGGVFVEEPESYYIAGGKVKKMSFPEWWRHFNRFSERSEILSVPSNVPRVQWSSEKNRKLCYTLSQRLVQYRNDEDMKAFDTLSQLATEKFPESGADLIVKAEQVVVAYKHCHFHKAESLLQQFATLLRNSKDSSIFEVRMLLLRSMIEHSKGKCKDSYATAQQGLQMMQQIPVDLTTVWFYIEVATVAITILTTTHDFQSYPSLKNEALQYLQLALTHANALEDVPYRMSDLRQKLHIYKVWILLECSVAGEATQGQRRIQCEDIEAAAGELVSVSKSVLKGSPLTHFRKIQYDLAQCDLFRRRSEILKEFGCSENLEDYIPNLKTAHECAWKARALAIKHHFENMVHYANKRLADLTEKFVRHAIDLRTEKVSNDFLGLKY